MPAGVRRHRGPSGHRAPAPLLLAALVLGSALGTGLGLSEAPAPRAPAAASAAGAAVRPCSVDQLSLTDAGASYSGGSFGFGLDVVNRGRRSCRIPSVAALVLDTTVRGIRDVAEPNTARPRDLILVPRQSDGAANGAELTSAVENWCSVHPAPPRAAAVELAGVGTLEAPLFFPDPPPTGCRDPSKPAVLLSPAGLSVWVPYRAPPTAS